MSVRIYGALFGAISLLSACDAAGTNTPTQDALTTTEFRIPNADGSFNVNFRQSTLPQTYRTSSGSSSGYSFQAGSINEEGLFAVAGILPGSFVTDPPRTGTAAYVGTYNLVTIDDIRFQTNAATGEREIIGQPTLVAGNLTLLANFDDNRIYDNGAGSLDVEGTVNGKDIGGTVTYNGVQGNLDGLIGGNRAIGAFHGEGNVGPGTDDDYMYAGGFIANPN